MAMHTGENEQGLRKILDMTRLIGITLLILHFYYYCYAAFQQWQLTATITDKLIGNMQDTGLFGNFHRSKAIALGFLLISLLGAKGRKDERIRYKNAFVHIIAGLIIYFFSYVCLFVHLAPIEASLLYMAITITGFILVLTGGTLFNLSSTIRTYSIRRMRPFHRKNGCSKTNTLSIYRHGII